MVPLVIALIALFDYTNFMLWTTRLDVTRDKCAMKPLKKSWRQLIGIDAAAELLKIAQQKIQSRKH